MTKRQPGTRPDGSPRTTLDPAVVVRAALELLDDKGADAVSVRGVADRLGVRMNTVLWHVKTKAGLLELMADAIVAEVSVERLPGTWEERVRELSHRYRRALLAHRDGAVIVAGTYAPEPATLGLAEALVGALLDAGLPEREAAWTCWTLVYFVLGLAQEEQALPGADGPRLNRALDSGRYPSLSRVAAQLRDPSFDERFAYGLSLILDSVAARAR
ncbi:TetR/AcrR family transcriptional regulator C-terminal domain-containing protein [Streptomyces corynorhini]|uniref:TetR/AcrR family transcriptional regulator n=1 Tax=Streptomyces corynorhini TaxID=2282652 RepID=A0A370B7I3_9ACTN|nr:TetR/AcrR family transcriptional regulator C-terminal domain-containing protein [Streptomyces corynorhini]RDG36349.1 TetR/AcrR family transcriptional regulator [Streptomyces corynorhini]